MYGRGAVGGQCKISERSFPGKALKGHTFKEFAVRVIVLLFSLPPPKDLLLKKNSFCSMSPNGRYCQSFIRSEHTFDSGLTPLKLSN